MIKILCLLLIANVVCYAVEVPAWIVRGIAFVETSSFIRNGQIIYVDTRIGKHGERGVFQMRKQALQTVAPGASVLRLQSDPEFAAQCAKKYLIWLYEGPADASWSRAIAMYNAGPSCRRITDYVRRVQEAGK